MKFLFLFLFEEESVGYQWGIRGDNSKFLKIIGNCNFKFEEMRRGNTLV